MKLLIAAVGTVRRAPEAELIARYQSLCPWKITIREVDANPKLPADKRLAAEAEKLRAATPPGALRVALDRTGKQLSSEALARIIATAQNERRSGVVFYIGGQDGLDAALLREADHIIAFGAATWPHMLARAMLAEQIYRAHAILSRHPYHSGH